ncbi:MAG: hypothetical protein L0H55_15060, partial [Candidatus Nitrosocosmicus sp.]|nr:hypothetical protein [Candidatus Nitrosocosmicus sp.]
MISNRYNIPISKSMLRFVIVIDNKNITAMYPIAFTYPSYNDIATNQVLCILIPYPLIILLPVSL